MAPPPPLPPGPRSPVAVLRTARSLDRDPTGTLDRLHDTYGDVVAVGGPPMRLVFAFGRDANEQILGGHARSFSWRKAMAPLVPVDGETALVVSDGDEHARRRRLVQPAFHRRRIDGYLRIMTEEADRAIDTLVEGEVVDAHATFRRAIRRTVVLVLFGEHLRRRADEIGDTLQPALDFLGLPVLAQQRIALPGTPYQRARRARRAVDRIIDEEVTRRRAGEDEPGEDDLLAMLLDAHDDTGTRLTDQELRDQVVSLIAAGYDTTSAAMGWTVDLLMREPGAWERVAAEVERVAGEHDLTVEHLRAMPELTGAVAESLRLHPPGAIVPRRTTEDIELLGHRVPKRSLVFYSPHATGRDARWWADPEEFRPARWDTARPDHVEAAPYSFVPFGGGSRRCLGFAFATLELQAMVARLVRRAVLEPASSTPPHPTGLATVAPGGGVPARVRSVRP